MEGSGILGAVHDHRHFDAHDKRLDVVVMIVVLVVMLVLASGMAWWW